MSIGIHWEWRAFGTVSVRFREIFFDLPVYYERHHVKDEYLWIPGIGLNAKFRTGVEDGLKIKRLKEKDGKLEKWEENPDEIFEFPLKPEAWHSLAQVLKDADIKLPAYPSNSPGRTEMNEILQQAGCEIITVKKTRESRLWNKVLIESASITEPQQVDSIGLENLPEEHAALTDDEAKKAIRSAIENFHLEDESLRVMNYMEAIKLWSGGRNVSSVKRK